MSEATDIAFVIGFLALLGSRVPFGLKILLLTLAIVDDIGAILVIAVAYTAQTSLWFLVIGAATFGVSTCSAGSESGRCPFTSFSGRASGWPS